MRVPPLSEAVKENQEARRMQHKGCLNPIQTHTLMPAVRQVSIAGPTSGRGGSCIAAMPTNVRPASSSGVTCVH